ncbi:hypothetical protein IB286_14030 [Spongiibacter sp. KMU-158]|uniref:Uncharacterized protein n=1 Tax=Spongiibacter pelagi TaxID=2760804 RepID=A0A927GXF7_9GAMM|nr:hypothetical protein [Spongiibacter pelagi]MBD2860118.1 hypothetical protein [Spongiibacter pelagi]
MFAIVLTALLSSLFTLALAAVILKYFALPKLEQYIDEKLLPEAQERVKDGVSDGVVEVLPKVKDHVRDGVTESFVDAASGGLLKRAPANIANNLESLTGMFFGKK